MHEFEVVESLVNELLPKLQEQGVKRVTEVRFRRGSTFSEEALLQAFSMLTQGTVLEGAKVEVEVTQTKFSCLCGHEQTITADDLIGHIFVCPKCGRAQEI
ncbi:MAG: hydrogenase/urease maturation nickel metallochaperone HypA, partial [Armatimonadota bacterium]